MLDETIQVRYGSVCVAFCEMKEENGWRKQSWANKKIIMQPWTTSLLLFGLCALHNQLSLIYVCVWVYVTDLDHGGDRVHSAHVLDNALSQVGHAQADGPVGVTLQLDHFIGAMTQHSN